MDGETVGSNETEVDGTKRLRIEGEASLLVFRFNANRDRNGMRLRFQR